MNADDHQPRQVLHVRKVRSEMKYVESYSKDNSKKRESKSDHEFANERDVSNVVLSIPKGGHKVQLSPRPLPLRN